LSGRTEGEVADERVVGDRAVGLGFHGCPERRVAQAGDDRFRHAEDGCHPVGDGIAAAPGLDERGDPRPQSAGGWVSRRRRGFPDRQAADRQSRLAACSAMMPAPELP
jgi:hypothetical protein